MNDKPPSYRAAGLHNDKPPSYRAASAQLDRNEGPVRQGSFADEVMVYRTQHVTATVSKIEGVLASRARHGLSKTWLLLLPQGQIDVSNGVSVVELEGTNFTTVELNGEADSVEFWTQRQTVVELHDQLVSEVNGGRTSGQGLIKGDVRLEKFHFRSETDFGLMQTVAATCMMVVLEEA